MITIKKIPLKDLQNFVKSDMYLNFENKPISTFRVNSYVNNPNADLDDVNLYLAITNDKLVGYRTLFAGSFVHQNDRKKFCWLSGSWTHKDFRRKGISSQLFNEIYKDWSGNIIFANYAPTSKALYDKTDVFTVLKTLKGQRYYRRFCLAEILPNKSIIFKKLKFLFVILDWFLNLFGDIRFSKIKELQHYKVQKISTLDENHSLFLEEFKANELFKRTIKTHQWIHNYPWIKSGKIAKIESKNYHFSTYAKYFNSNFYQIKDYKTDKIAAIINVSIRNKELKIPYLYTLPETNKVVKNLILNLCKEHKINYLTIYNNELNEALKNTKNSFLKQKEFEQKFYISKTLLEEFEHVKNGKVQTGDGDGVFT